MPRPHRIEIAGVPLHVIQRGNNRTACFFGDIDRRFYLKCLGDAASRRGCAIHAYALMTNHVHLLLTPSETGAASAMMQHLGRRYVRTVNNAHERTGTLWEGRFKSNLVDSDTYLLSCHRYIELNPVRAGMVSSPADYPWTSHPHYASGKSDRLITEHGLYLGLGTTPEERRKAFLSFFDEDVSKEELLRLRIAINRGWALGSDAFLVRMEEKTGKALRPPRRGRPRNPEAEAPESEVQAELLL